jgi:hypothetical protein
MIEIFEKLLLDFQKIPRVKENQPTFIEIAGFPHYENVCSNILSFYFSTYKSHGLKDLFIKSLFECIGEDDKTKTQIEINNIEREVSTNKGNRLDIVIESDSFVIGIENKIWANLYNDLTDYSKHLDKHYKEFEKIKIVLSINGVSEDKLCCGFRSVKYSDFLNRVKYNLGDYSLNAETKYLIYLIDFINTIQNLTKPNIMNKEMFEFFLENQDVLDDLFEERDKLNNEIQNMILQIRSRVDELSGQVRQWVYQKCNLVHDFTMSDGIIVAVDCIINLRGLEIKVWVRSGNVTNENYLNSLLYFKENPIIDYPSNHWIQIYKPQDMPFSTPIEEVAGKLNHILQRIHY